MPVLSIGDQSMNFMSLRNGGEIKSSLARLTNELSSGKAADLTAHLDGDTRQFSGLAHSLRVLSAHQSAFKETSLVLNHMQTNLEHFDSSRANIMSEFLTLGPVGVTTNFSQLAASGRDAFDSLVGTLNAEFGGKSLFAGSALDANALSPGTAMLDDIRSRLVGATTQTQVEDVVEAWFSDTGGGFETLGYSGDLGNHQSLRISSDNVSEIAIRADDPRVRSVLQGVALGVVAAEMSTELLPEDQASLLQTAGALLLKSAGGVVELQGYLGGLQSSLEVNRSRNESEKTAVQIAINERSNIDPFETASKLQAIQLQLETHFTVSARLAQLNFAEYI